MSCNDGVCLSVSRPSLAISEVDCLATISSHHLGQDADALAEL
jgi:hypothetical protein